MICYLELCLLFSSIISIQDIKLLNELPSEDLRENFDSFPLVSRTVQESDWCKVSQKYSVRDLACSVISGCQGVDQIDEVREVEGELYSKVSVFQHITAKHVRDTNSGAAG